tara:strand:- start:50 stop:238 length:189 start_codon:yes stop_codon:yes gene_type:complete
MTPCTGINADAGKILAINANNRRPPPTPKETVIKELTNESETSPKTSKGWISLNVKISDKIY